MFGLILVLLIIYLVSPLVETGFIIALAIKNSEYKKIIKELKSRLEERSADGEKVSEHDRVSEARNSDPLHHPVISANCAQEVQSGRKTADSQNSAPKENGLSGSVTAEKPAAVTFLKQGNIPLIIGVVFVLLAGLIFATTTWNRLASAGKVVLVLGGSITFFFASFIAVKKLHIEKTGKAFYILGSAFLFVTVLSVGYFGILGYHFTLTGRYRFFLLALGILLADGALFAGLKRFGEKLYSYICMFGVTAGVACLIGGFNPTQLGFTTGMAFYGILLLFPARKGQDLTNGFFPDILTKTFPSFAVVNLWGISALVLCNTGFGLMSGLVTLFMAGIHLFLGMEKENGSIYAGSAFLFTGILRMVSPETMDGWLYTGGITVIVLMILEHGGFVNESSRKYFQWTGIAAAVLLFLAASSWSLLSMEITLPGVICMGILTLDITILAAEKKHTVLKAAWSGVLTVFIHHFVLYLPIRTEYQILIMAVVFGIAFFAGQKKPFMLKSNPGDIIYTAVILADALLLLMMMQRSDQSNVLNSETFQYAMLATAAILILTAAAERWSRKIPVIRYGMPLAAGLLTLTAGVLLEYLLHITVPYKIILFAFLLLVAAWDLVKKDDFLYGILAIGTLAAFIIHRHQDNMIPYSLLLSAYLALKAKQKSEKSGEERRYYDYGICLYALSGTYQAVYNIIEANGYRMLAMAGTYLVLYYIYKASGKTGITNETEGQNKQGNMRGFFEVTGSLVYTGLITAYYAGSSLGLWFLIPVLAFFICVYLLCYHGRFSWLNILTTLVTLGIPLLLDERYDLSRNQFYGYIMAALLVSGIMFRCYQPVMVKTEENKLRIDWYHILIVLVLVPMLILAMPHWDFFYTLLLAAYVMQFAAVRSLRNMAFTVAGILCCLAIRYQVFFTWPILLKQEIHLIPAALFIFSLPFIWGRKKVVENVQTLLYFSCFLVLTGDAFRTQNIVDALLLEAICLVVFLGAFRMKCKRWVCLSGGVITAVAVYLTKGFWLSLSWWVYLLAAGIGLIIFAAINERKKSGK